MSPPTNKRPYESAKSPADVDVWKPNLPDRYLRNPSILFPIANIKSRPVDSRVCFLYARFIYKTKRLIAPQHNRLIVFNSSFSKLYRDVGIFSGQSNIPCMGIRCIAWCLEGCVTSFLLLVNLLCHLALKRAVWCLKIDPVAWPELIREEVFMVTQFRHKRLMGKLFILHGDHGDSHFVGILVDDIAEIAKTFLQTESTGRDPDNLLRWIISHFLSNVFAGVPNENKIRRKGCTQRSR